jgi:hypothetical protein
MHSTTFVNEETLPRDEMEQSEEIKDDQGHDQTHINWSKIKKQSRMNKSQNK